MQPYLFAYLPYFQLISSVDHFVIFDTVQYTRKGWINRNQILLNGQAHTFRIPVGKAPQTASIQEIRLATGVCGKARKLRNLFDAAYDRAPYKSQLWAVLGPFLDELRPAQPLLSHLTKSLRATCALLEIDTNISFASELAPRKSQSAQGYILDICRELGASEYVNPIGGQQLYDPQVYEQNEVRLRFLRSSPRPYKQFGQRGFVENLSILDLLAHLPASEIRSELQSFDLV